MMLGSVSRIPILKYANTITTKCNFRTTWKRMEECTFYAWSRWLSTPLCSPHLRAVKALGMGHA